LRQIEASELEIRNQCALNQADRVRCNGLQMEEKE
jgi:hypothetical protein